MASNEKADCAEAVLSYRSSLLEIDLEALQQSETKPFSSGAAEL